jgi:dTDP-4-dehydrorhamnose reductase
LPLRVPATEYRNPIDVLTLCEWTIELIRSGAPAGIYHLGSRDAISRYDLAAKLATKLGYPESLVLPEYGAVPGRAPRGRHHFLIPDKIQSLFSIPVPTSGEVIQRCVDAVTESAARARV